ncbi:MAG TPA: hypothetical protein VMH28_04855 [Candidatus Acidoferrales bacterium]|nr:hypothetical protein [Candidatus Acidoferrales bacterium]
MLYDSTKVLLKSILDGLEKPAQPEWDGEVESCHQCLYEMHQMCRPAYKAYQWSRSDKHALTPPDPQRLTRAIPHMKLMLGAIRRRDRKMALERGNAALAELNGHIQPAPVERPLPKRVAPLRKPVRRQPHRKATRV